MGIRRFASKNSFKEKKRTKPLRSILLPNNNNNESDKNNNLLNSNNNNERVGEEDLTALNKAATKLGDESSDVRMKKSEADDASFDRYVAALEEEICRISSREHALRAANAALLQRCAHSARCADEWRGFANYTQQFLRQELNAYGGRLESALRENTKLATKNGELYALCEYLRNQRTKLSARLSDAQNINLKNEALSKSNDEVNCETSSCSCSKSSTPISLSESKLAAANNDDEQSFYDVTMEQKLHNLSHFRAHLQTNSTQPLGAQSEEHLSISARNAQIFNYIASLGERISNLEIELSNTVSEQNTTKTLTRCDKPLADYDFQPLVATSMAGNNNKNNGIRVPSLLLLNQPTCRHLPYETNMYCSSSSSSLSAKSNGRNEDTAERDFELSEKPNAELFRKTLHHIGARAVVNCSNRVSSASADSAFSMASSSVGSASNDPHYVALLPKAANDQRVCQATSSRSSNDDASDDGAVIYGRREDADDERDASKSMAANEASACRCECKSLSDKLLSNNGDDDIPPEMPQLLISKLHKNDVNEYGRRCENYSNTLPSSLSNYVPYKIGNQRSLRLPSAAITTTTSTTTNSIAKLTTTKPTTTATVNGKKMERIRIRMPTTITTMNMTTSASIVTPLLPTTIVTVMPKATTTLSTSIVMPLTTIPATARKTTTTTRTTADTYSTNFAAYNNKNLQLLLHKTIL